MNISNMKMVFVMETNRHVLKIRLKSTAGGDGFSGIAAIVSAIATIKILVPTDISVSDL